MIDTGDEGHHEPTLNARAVTCVNFYVSEKAAREAAKRYGGITLEVVANSIKGQEFEDACLARDDEEKEKSPRSAFVTVVFGKDLPYDWDDENLCAEFKQRAIEWLTQFESETGICPTQ